MSISISGLKGQTILAQPSGLGTELPHHRQRSVRALYKTPDYPAPAGRTLLGTSPHRALPGAKIPCTFSALLSLPYYPSCFSCLSWFFLEKSGTLLDKFGAVLELFGVILENFGIIWAHFGAIISPINSVFNTKNKDSLKNSEDSSPFVAILHLKIREHPRNP